MPHLPAITFLALPLPCVGMLWEVYALFLGHSIAAAVRYLFAFSWSRQAAAISSLPPPALGWRGLRKVTRSRRKEKGLRGHQVLRVVMKGRIESSRVQSPPHLGSRAGDELVWSSYNELGVEVHWTLVPSTALDESKSLANSL